MPPIWEANNRSLQINGNVLLPVNNGTKVEAVTFYVEERLDASTILG